MTGWVCPKCGSVFAPFVAECRFFSGPQTVVTYTGTNNTDVCPSCRGPREQVAMTGCPAGWHSGVWCRGA